MFWYRRLYVANSLALEPLLPDWVKEAALLYVKGLQVDAKNPGKPAATSEQDGRILNHKKMNLNNLNDLTNRFPPVKPMVTPLNYILDVKQRIQELWFLTHRNYGIINILFQNAKYVEICHTVIDM